LWKMELKTCWLLTCCSKQGRAAEKSSITPNYWQLVTNCVTSRWLDDSWELQCVLFNKLDVPVLLKIWGVFRPRNLLMCRVFINCIAVTVIWSGSSNKGANKQVWFPLAHKPDGLGKIKERAPRFGRALGTGQIHKNHLKPRHF
jgi:hypothetical protein